MPVGIYMRINPEIERLSPVYVLCKDKVPQLKELNTLETNDLPRLVIIRAGDIDSRAEFVSLANSAQRNINTEFYVVLTSLSDVPAVKAHISESDNLHFVDKDGLAGFLEMMDEQGEGWL